MLADTQQVYQRLSQGLQPPRCCDWLAHVQSLFWRLWGGSNAGVDGMVSVIAHELEETNTDPNLNAWYDANGAEDADKCAWTFGQILSQGSTGAYYNMTLPTPSGGARPFLIQREPYGT